MSAVEQMYDERPADESRSPGNGNGHEGLSEWGPQYRSFRSESIRHEHANNDGG
jgi:hypothetical protein